jgi:hypothetical protein
MSTCEELLYKGFVVRYLTTFLSLGLLGFYFYNKNVKTYIYLIIPILLSVLDSVDNKIAKFHGKNCTNTFYYQTWDKVCDSFSYVLTYLFLCFFLKSDVILLFFVLYRIVGVLLFSMTKNSRWLVVFFDFVKEYLVYLFLFGRNFNYIPIFIIGKILFEGFFHTMHNANNYT